MLTTTSLQPGAPELVIRILEELANLGITGDDFTAIDHLSYRVETLERYEELKREISENNELVDESVIDGRPISVFKLSEPVGAEGYEITALELPAPSAIEYVEGWEHAEMVVPSLDAFITAHPDVPFNTTGLSKALNKEVMLTFDGCAVKFHERHILDVVVLQKETGLI